MVELEDEIALEKNKKHTIDIVVERLIVKPEARSRIAEAVELAVKFSRGYVRVLHNDEHIFYSTVHACPHCGYRLNAKKNKENVKLVLFILGIIFYLKIVLI